MAHPSYPRSMYRLAEGGFEYEGRHFAIIEVGSEKEEVDAKKDGWANHPDDCKSDPLDHDGDGKKGGSAKGPASTAAKGAVKRKAVKRDARK